MQHTAQLAQVGTRYLDQTDETVPHLRYEDADTSRLKIVKKKNLPTAFYRIAMRYTNALPQNACGKSVAIWNITRENRNVQVRRLNIRNLKQRTHTNICTHIFITVETIPSRFEKDRFICIILCESFMKGTWQITFLSHFN